MATNDYEDVQQYLIRLARLMSGEPMTLSDLGRELDQMREEREAFQNGMARLMEDLEKKYGKKEPETYVEATWECSNPIPTASVLAGAGPSTSRSSQATRRTDAHWLRGLDVPRHQPHRQRAGSHRRRAGADLPEGGGVNSGWPVVVLFLIAIGLMFWASWSDD